jgi:hypothetical protein
LEKEEESDFCDSDRHRFNVVKYLQYQNWFYLIKDDI